MKIWYLLCKHPTKIRAANTCRAQAAARTRGVTRNEALPSGLSEADGKVETLLPENGAKLKLLR